MHRINVGIVLFILLGLFLMPAEAVSTKAENNVEYATLAGGCFWCTEAFFEKTEGVIDVISGYTGGRKETATYDQTSSGKTDHVEAIKVSFDPTIISYSTILDVFWRTINPTDDGGQYVDRGPQYRTVIFYYSEEQKAVAERSREALGKSGRFEKPIVTRILPAGPFYEAEEHHQDYYKKKPLRYKWYYYLSGRDKYLDKKWGEDRYVDVKKTREVKYMKPSQEEIKNKLTPLQYKVTQQDGTERAFDNEYWDNKREGIYVDIVSGEPLFSSTDKFKSGTGWPSFTKPLEPENIVEKEDYSFFMKRTEVRSKHGDSHLGHLFNDGPEPTGMRYCINSAALRFIPKEELEEQGYKEYAGLFQ